MIRAGRFKHRLLEQDFLHSKAMDKAIDLIQEFKSLHIQNQISNTEWTAIYIFILSYFRRPKDFLGGPHKEFETRQISGALQMQDIRKIMQLPILNSRIQDTENFLEVFCTHSLRSIPLSVQKSISFWHSNPQRLIHFEHIPSPEDVMNMQALGRRCVSVLTKPTEMQSFVEAGRDVLGFVVHDLIHADHFFQDPEQAQTQIAFSRKMQILNALPEIQNRIKTDIEFMNEWHYLISDMNTVSLHLLKSLKAILLASYKRQHNVAYKDDLPATTELEFQTFWSSLGAYFELKSEQIPAWQSLNTNSFKIPHDALILNQVLC